MKLRVAGSDHVTRNDETIKALSSNNSLAAITIDLRDTQPDPDQLLRAKDRLQEITGSEVLPLEEDVAKIVRKYFPQYQIDFSGLTSRLASIPLIDPSHSKRAQELTVQLASILQGDGTDAIARFGKEESPVYQSLVWARKTTKELNDGLEATLRRIGAADTEWKAAPRDEATQDFIETSTQELAEITNILSTESFHDQWAKLQGLATKLEQGLINVKKALIDHGPLFITVMAGGSGWSGATDTVTSCRKRGGTNHMVQLVGYNKTHWIIKNSWGTNWGDQGYAKIKYGCDFVAEEAGYVTVK